MLEEEEETKFEPSMKVLSKHKFLEFQIAVINYFSKTIRFRREDSQTLYADSKSIVIPGGTNLSLNHDS